MTTATDRVLLVDSASLYYRAYYGYKRRMPAPDGTPMNAVHGFFAMLASAIERVQPRFVVPCWDDDWRPAWRVEAFSGYKAQRVVGDCGQEDTPAKLVPQIPVLRSALQALGWPPVGAAQAEADDVIGTLAQQWVDARSGPVTVLSGDRDMFQLVDDAADVSVLYPQGAGKGWLVVDEAERCERVGLAADCSYLEYALLVGDSSDGLPGVKGFGAKTAATMLARYGSLQQLRAAAASGAKDIPAAKAQALIDSAVYLETVAEVIRVRTDVALPNDPFVPVDEVLWDSPKVLDISTTFGIESALSTLRDKCKPL